VKMYILARDRDLVSFESEDRYDGIKWFKQVHLYVLSPIY